MHEDRSEWIRCKPWIEAALQYADGTHTIDDIEDGIEKGLFQFWSGRSSAVVTELIDYPRKRELNFFLVGGDLGELKLMEPLISMWAREQGCQRVRAGGRKGFERICSNGFKARWTYYAKDLTA